MDFVSYPDFAMDSIIKEATFDFIYNKCVNSEVQGIQRLAIYCILGIRNLSISFTYCFLTKGVVL